MKWLAGLLLAMLLALGFWAYLQPGFMVDVGNMLSACF